MALGEENQSHQHKDATEQVDPSPNQTQVQPNAEVNNLKTNNNVDKDSSKRKSWVWEHFTYVENMTETKCPYCKKVLKCQVKKNGTSALGNHLKDTCKTSPVYKGKHLNKKQKTLEFYPNCKTEGGNVEIYGGFSQERCRKSLARMCIKDNRPFSIVEDEGFSEFIWDLNPKFKLPTRWTVARDCLKIYADEAKSLKSLLKGQRVSLTTDTWTSVQNINYMCLTAHWVDKDWKLVKKILNFCQISNHKGETIGKLVYACLVKWGIEKVFTVTVDNASSNDGAIKFLKKKLKGPDAILDCAYLHLRCCAHVINLVVKDGLEDQRDSIIRIRKAVRYVRSSPSRLIKFEDCVEKEKIKCDKKVSLDVETRWNSTYMMLETAVRYENAFHRLESDDNAYGDYFFGGDDEDVSTNTRATRRRKKKNIVIGSPQKTDWDSARYFIEFLKVFYKVTMKISGSRYLTSNLFFNELVKMHLNIEKMCSSGDSRCCDMARRMKEKYDKYWKNIDNINFLLYVAVLLDPRKKMQYVEFTFAQIYVGEREKQILMKERAKNTLEVLYKDYVRLQENSSSDTKTKKVSANCSSATHMSVDDEEDDGDLEMDFQRHLEAEESKENKSEIDVYLSDGVERGVNEDFDVLLWWKANSTKFPILSQVAKNVLAMPITTVASESTFSVGGRVIDPFRSSLTPRTAEALICSQDWIRSKPTDIETSLGIVEEIRQKLEEVEIGLFFTLFFASCHLLVYLCIFLNH